MARELLGDAEAQPAELEDKIEELYLRALRSYGDFVLPVTVRPGIRRPMVVVAGHLWGDPKVGIEGAHGPSRADVMVVGKMLGAEEVARKMNFVGPSGELLFETCQRLGIDPSDWYVTNLLKTEHPEGRGKTAIKSAWLRDWLPILHEELRLVRPKYILCLGADALKALLGRSATMSSMEGRIEEIEIPLAVLAGDPPAWHKALVMAAPHPAAVVREPEELSRFEMALLRFARLCKGIRCDLAETDIDHRVIDSLDALLALEKEIAATIEDNLIAIDAEWHGDHPQNAGAYLRSVQLSWKPKTAACVSLRHPGGAPRFQGGIDNAIATIRRICRGRKIAGHYFNADLEFLVANGLDLREEFCVAETWEQYMEDWFADRRGGFDTALAMHAVEETADFDLKTLALRYTTAPRYDAALREWEKQYRRANKIKASDLKGFGDCPDEILEPYAAYDADVTRRLAVVLQNLLTCDRFGNCCWEPFWATMRANRAVLEINTTGLLVDRRRMDELTDIYLSAKEEFKRRLRELARWPDFNPDSPLQVREFLFGESFTAYPSSRPRRQRPAGAISLYLDPVITTDKPAMNWADVVALGLEAEKTPSTDRTALAILANEASSAERYYEDDSRIDCAAAVTWLRHYRVVSQVLRTTLREPAAGGEGEALVDDEGNRVYEGGLPGSICDDGRVRTTIYPTLETGRWSSARPNCQNVSKRREEDYKRILGDKYRWPIRTIFRAPEGCLLVEADYKSAEMVAMAVMSGDSKLIEHVHRNQLPENHPDYYDIHSRVACSAFHFDCEPTKAGLASIGKKKMRDVAKTVVYGIAYGRGAKAIALGAREEGIQLSIEEAQRVIDAFLGLYPSLVPLAQACHERVHDPGWICNAFGRFRRFPRSRDRQVVAELERQAMNFIIQSLVADVMNRAISALYDYRSEHPDVEYRIVLQIHDAVLLEVPYEHVARVVDEVLPACMTDAVPIYATDLDGVPTGAGPYRLGIDTHVYLRWGELLLPDACLSCGVDPRYAGWQDGGGDTWVHEDLPGKCWKRGKIVPLARAKSEQRVGV